MKQSRIAASVSTAGDVPNEAAYHIQLLTGLRQWLTLWSHADVLPEADGNRQGTNKRYADILIIGRRVSNPPKHVVELVANTTDADVQQHYTRAIAYMTAHGTDRGTCITFTAVVSAAATAVASASLAWPSEQQLATGLAAIHVVHDLAWTTATVLSQRQGELVDIQRVDLRKH